METLEACLVHQAGCVLERERASAGHRRPGGQHARAMVNTGASLKRGLISFFFSFMIRPAQAYQLVPPTSGVALHPSVCSDMSTIQMRPEAVPTQVQLTCHNQQSHPAILLWALPLPDSFRANTIFLFPFVPLVLQFPLPGSTSCCRG